jgi:5-methylcytosine-specific restriction endonuclease McrA
MTDNQYTRKYYPWVFETLARDGYKCTDCGIANEVKHLVVHHMDGSRRFGERRMNNSLDNLVTLCKPCHAKEHGYLRDRRKVILMRAAGKTFQQIADKLGVSRQRAHNMFKTAHS